MSVINKETNEDDIWSWKIFLEACLEIIMGLEM